MHSIDEKIYGCWLGKAIGGTLGLPLEGLPGPHSLTFYDPVPSEPLPNDDLDLQVVWAHHLLETNAKRVTPDVLLEAWRKHVKFPWDEYAVLLRNTEYQVSGYKVGAYDNWFAECMGAAIRSELWACIAPGEPERAAGFAWCDAVCDHAGDGVWAEVFFAALQSAAFVESDPNILLDTALSLLPPDSRVRRAVEACRRWWAEERDWLAVRTKLDVAFGRPNFTDVAVNLGYTVLGLLAGEGDFGKSLCFAVNCGTDTDCTGATLGALLGILDPSSIPETWRTPIGDTIVLSKEIAGVTPPASLGEFVSWTARLRGQLRDDHPRPGIVEPHRPATIDEAPPVTVAARSREAPPGAFDAESADAVVLPGADGGWREERFPGHWIVRRAADFPEGGILFEMEFHLESEQELLAMAFSSTETAAWIDGKLAVGPSSIGRPQSGPSFHRKGSTTGSAGTLAPGRHLLHIAWARPEGREVAELVFGLADAKTEFWLPFALARPVSPQ